MFCDALTRFTLDDHPEPYIRSLHYSDPIPPTLYFVFSVH